MTRTVSMLVALGVIAATPAAAQNMPLSTFVKRGTALEKKGPLALLQQAEIKALQTEMQGASVKVLAEYEANKKAGKKTAFCPVKGEKYQLGAQQMLAELRAIPAGRASTMTTTDGMRYLLVKRYPCSR